MSVAVVVSHLVRTTEAKIKVYRGKTTVYFIWLLMVMVKKRKWGGKERKYFLLLLLLFSSRHGSVVFLGAFSQRNLQRLCAPARVKGFFGAESKLILFYYRFLS